MPHHLSPGRPTRPTRIRAGLLAALGAQVLLALGAGVRGLQAQAPTATADVEENFRAGPNGTVLARVRPGTVLGVEGEEGRWIRGTLDGWVWTRSLQATDRNGFDLRVSANGGENMRSRPNGTILAHLEEGTLLEELERTEGWTRARRTGWIWAPSVRRDPADEAGGRGGAGSPADAAPAPPSSRWSRSPGGGAAILSDPDGDTLARTAPDVDLRVLGRQGNWARVRVEGWAWMPAGDAGIPADSAVLQDVSPADVSREPDRYRGRVVSWEVQYISLERAERFRTDFYEGEPYLLARPAAGSDFFVYVALPPEREEVARDLTPLERIRVVGRIRTGSAALTGGPILDLLELTRAERSGAGAAPP